MLTQSAALTLLLVVAPAPVPASQGAAAAAAPAASAPNAPATAANAETAASGVTTGGVLDPAGEWRGARWGMSVEEVLTLFKGEARRVEPELKLADGNVVALRIDGLKLAGRAVRAAFVFEGGKLGLVSLRTLERDYAPPEAFVDATKQAQGAFGGAGVASSDDNFVDMRQVTWTLPKGAVDLKYIPGVMVLLYRPTPASEIPPFIKRP